MEHNINEKMLINFIMELNRTFPEMKISEKFKTFSNDFEKSQKKNTKLKNSFIEKNNG